MLGKNIILIICMMSSRNLGGILMIRLDKIYTINFNTLLSLYDKMDLDIYKKI